MQEILLYTIGSTVLIAAFLWVVVGDLLPKRKWGENNGKRR